MGDGVYDTPAQARPKATSSSSPPPTELQCPQPFPNTCPLHRGRDPVDNLMSYSPDACREKFTHGQAIRMHEAWKAYRASSSESPAR